jgi:hypothetical protein
MLVFQPATMDDILANSVKDYHVKGFDYICLKRTPDETVKLYFFDGDVAKLPEVVNPHDHRYDFHTTCLAGSVTNRNFRRDGSPGSCKRYQRFEWMTPLNGGAGFRWAGEVDLVETQSQTVEAGGGYYMRSHGLHTIRLNQSGTILMLRQFEDIVPLDVPTQTFTQSKEPPDVSGMYGKFTADQVMSRLIDLFRATEIQIPVL